MGLSLLACGLVDNFPLCSKLPTGPTAPTTTMVRSFLFDCQGTGGQLFDSQLVNFSMATTFLYLLKWSTFRWPNGQPFI